MTPRARFALLWAAVIGVLVGVALLSGDLDATRRHERRMAEIKAAVATSGVQPAQGKSHE